MKVFNFTDISSEYFLSALFPVNDDTGEVDYDYEALQVMSFVSDTPLIMVVDGVRHHLQSGSFVYGLIVSPDSNVHVYGVEGNFTFYCQSVSHPIPPMDVTDVLVVDQPADEADAYDSFLQAQKLVHQNIYASDIDPDDDDEHHQQP